jgi:hypothetical protein
MIENSLLAVSVIYVEVYVNPAAEGKNTLQKRVQFINIGFPFSPVFALFVPELRLSAGSYTKWLS